MNETSLLHEKANRIESPRDLLELSHTIDRLAQHALERSDRMVGYFMGEEGALEQPESDEVLPLSQ